MPIHVVRQSDGTYHYTDWDSGQRLPATEAAMEALRLAREGLDKYSTGGPGTNTGHGHVWPRPDGIMARCGGPATCPECKSDQKKWGDYPDNMVDREPERW